MFLNIIICTIVFMIIVIASSIAITFTRHFASSIFAIVYEK